MLTLVVIMMLLPNISFCDDNFESDIEPIDFNANTQSPAVEKRIYFKRSEEGWHFYNEVKEETPKKEMPLPSAVAPPVPLTPLEELEQVQQDLENARAAAVLYPSQNTIQSYLVKNQWMMQRAALFADEWRRAVWQTPSLDYSQRRPNNTMALQVFHDQREEQQSQAIAAIAGEYGLWFFFRGSCPYCHRFAPILQAFSQRYGIQVMPVTLDGGSLPGYPNPRFDQTVARELEVESVPSVYLINPKTRDIIPVATGLISADALKERIYILTQTEPGEDF